MSASEKLTTLNERHTLSGLKVVPIFRKTGSWLEGAEAFTRARDVETVMDALPELLAVVAAAEAEQEFFGPDADAKLSQALAALEKKLGNAASR